MVTCTLHVDQVSHILHNLFSTWHILAMKSHCVAPAPSQGPLALNTPETSSYLQVPGPSRRIEPQAEFITIEKISVTAPSLPQKKSERSCSLYYVHCLVSSASYGTSRQQCHVRNLQAQNAAGPQHKSQIPGFMLQGRRQTGALIC